MSTVPGGTSGSSAVPGFRFGPSALLTPANFVTVLRFALTLPLLAVISAEGASWRAWVGWCILGSTDGLDGWLARRDGTTRSGAFLDPLADKALVLGAMWALVAADRFWWLPVALITVREVGISAFRSYWGRRGLAVPASFWAKVKTVVQAVAVGIALFPPIDRHPGFGSAALWVATALTLVTGAQYVVEGSRATSAGGVRHAR